MASERRSPMHPEPRRFSIRLPRPLWIGLATGVMVVVAVGMQFGVPIYRRHVAIREIERLGGKFETSKGGPEWLRRWLGDKPMRYFDSDSNVDLGGTNFSDADVGQFEWLIDVQNLNLHDSRVTDAGLAHLGKFNGLRHLVALDLRNLAISDLALSHLSGMSSLESINFGSMMVGSGWPAGRRITDAGMIHLRGLTNLMNLDLNGTMVTDTGLEEIGRLATLTHLWLASTPVSDAGMSHLKSLPRLEVLCLRGTRVSTAGIREVRSVLPKLYVME